MRELRAIDLFCGVGGTTLGLKDAGFNVIGAIDCMKEAVEGYSQNHPKVKVWEGDIKKISVVSVMKELNIKKGDLDLLAGCPPCQGFSRIKLTNKKKTYDERNDLVFQYIRFVKQMYPKTIMLENVPGLMNDKRMDKIEKLLVSKGYDLDYKILDAADYSVPQRRKRFILIGSRVGKVNLARQHRQKKTVRDAIKFLEKQHKDELHNIRPRYSKKVLSIIKKIKKDGGLRSDLPKIYHLPCHKKTQGFKDVYGRMKWDDVAPTLTGGCTSASKGRFLHPEENRAITLREASILQGFPETYHFPLHNNKQSTATLIGNAFPPNFTKAHALELAKVLKQEV